MRTGFDFLTSPPPEARVALGGGLACIYGSLPRRGPDSHQRDLFGGMFSTFLIFFEQVCDSVFHSLVKVFEFLHPSHPIFFIHPFFLAKNSLLTRPIDFFLFSFFWRPDLPVFDTGCRTLVAEPLVISQRPARGPGIPRPQRSSSRTCRCTSQRPPTGVIRNNPRCGGQNFCLLATYCCPTPLPLSRKWSPADCVGVPEAGKRLLVDLGLQKDPDPYKRSNSTFPRSARPATLHLPHSPVIVSRLPLRFTTTLLSCPPLPAWLSWCCFSVCMHNPPK